MDPAAPRAEVQAANTLPPERFAPLLTARIEPAMIARPPTAGILTLWLETYWRLARRRTSRGKTGVRPAA